MEYKVQWAENKTAKTGKPYKKLSIEDLQGVKTDVNIFSDFPDFANITPGSTISGTLTQKGQYWNITSETQIKGGYTPRSTPQSAISASVKQAQERTEQSIGKTLDRKEESIKLAGAQRDAVLIVTAIGITDITEHAIKHEIIKWRNWFALSKDFNDIPPFDFNDIPPFE